MYERVRDGQAGAADALLVLLVHLLWGGLVVIELVLFYIILIYKFLFTILDKSVQKILGSLHGD